MSKLKIAKAGIFVIMVLVFIAFMPVIPMTAFSLNDPVSISDSRIHGSLTESQLEAILDGVRERQFISAKEALFGFSSLKIFQLGIDKDGKAIVFLGNDGGKKAGSYVRLELNKLEGKWVIVSNRWFMS